MPRGARYAQEFATMPDARCELRARQRVTRATASAESVFRATVDGRDDRSGRRRGDGVRRRADQRDPRLPPASNRRLTQSSTSRAHCFDCGESAHELRAVRRTRVHVQLGGHAGLREPQRVVDVLVAEAVGTADAHDRGRQPAEVRRRVRPRPCTGRRRRRRGRRGTTSNRTRSTRDSTPRGGRACTTA